MHIRHTFACRRLPHPPLVKARPQGVTVTRAPSVMQQRKKIVHANPDARPANAPLNGGSGGIGAVRPSANAPSPLINSFFPIFFLLLVPRFIAANRAPISDCDETFNFWEAVHHFTFRGGQQTWEQAPQYALRSWLYAGLHAVLFKIVSTCVPWISSPCKLLVSVTLCTGRHILGC